MQSGLEQLSPRSWLGADIRDRPYPCCTMVSVWLLAVQGYSATTWDGWRSMDPDLWDSVNVRTGDPWGGVAYVAKTIGDGYAFACVGKHHTAWAPPLRAKSWHYVQRWRRIEGDGGGYAYGHAYLIWHDGKTATVYQSNTDEGYTIGTGEWQGSAGLSGYDVAVAYLPSVPH